MGGLSLGGRVFGMVVILAKKLDRYLDDVDWRLIFSHSIAEFVDAHDSDQNSILFSCMKSNSNVSNPFNF